MELSEEEKKTIKDLTELLLEDNLSQSGKRKLVEIINKQQEEIEKYEQQIDLEFVEKNFIEKNKVISKDKIREKIKKAKEIKWHTPKLVIEYFEELLEEN